jgi:hypothetical protein
MLPRFVPPACSRRISLEHGRAARSKRCLMADETENYPEVSFWSTTLLARFFCDTCPRRFGPTSCRWSRPRPHRVCCHVTGLLMQHQEASPGVGTVAPESEPAGRALGFPSTKIQLEDAQIERSANLWSFPEEKQASIESGGTAGQSLLELKARMVFCKSFVE